MTRYLGCALLVALPWFASCGPGAEDMADPTPSGPEPEAVSLFGEPLSAPELPAETRAEREAELALARESYDRNPDDADAIIWLGRRTAYLGQYGEALRIFGEGVDKFPDDPRMLRHRGHRQITTRRFDLAIEDLERAAAMIAGKPDEIEPDGLPNARNQPTSTSHSNIWYHLGLTYYLLGDFENAARCYRECMKFSTNPDMLSATSHWLYMTLRRLGQHDEAQALLEPIDAAMDVIENRSYHQLLLMYKGEKTPEELRRMQTEGDDGIDFATVGYGIANWHLVNRRPVQAEAIMREIVAGEQWAAFGYLAAEAELYRAGVRLSPAGDR